MIRAATLTLTTGFWLIIIGAGELFAAQSNFVEVQLPHGLKIEMSRNWTVFSGKTRTLLDSSVEARLGTADFRGALNFAANLYSEAGPTIAIMNVRYYPEKTVTQSEVKNITRSEFREFDVLLREALVKGLDKSGIKFLSWGGSQIVNVNGMVAILSQYRRKSITGSGAVFKVQLVRVLAGPRSFTLTASYDESLEFLLKPIIDRMVRSIKASPVIQ